MSTVDQKFQEFVQAEADKYGLSRAEREALNLAVEGRDIVSIGQYLQVKPEAIRQRLSLVYQKFGIGGKGPVKLAKLQQIIRSHYQQYQDQNTIAIESLNFEERLSYPRLDWGNAPDIKFFYGRNQEIGRIKQWFLIDRVRMALIVGERGLGKTVLALQLAKQIKEQFEVVVWRSLANESSPSVFLTNLLQHLYQEGVEIPPEYNSKISLLIEYFSQHRCLLLLDDVDKALSQVSFDSEDSSTYDQLLKKIAEVDHNSCILINTCSASLSVGYTPEKLTAFRTLNLTGLSLEAAHKILESSKNFSATKQQLSQLVKLFGGNPLLLDLVGTTVSEFCQGNLAEFLQKNSANTANLLGQLIGPDKLSSLENQVLEIIAVSSEPIALSELQAKIRFGEDLPGAITNYQLTKVLESLEARLVVDYQNQGGVNKFVVTDEVKQKINALLTAKYLNQIGYKKYLEGEFKSAKYYLEKAIEFNPFLAAAHYNLANTYEEINELAKACYHYEVASRDKNYAADAATSNLARLEIFQGNSTKAIQSILRILDRVRDDGIKSSLLKNLGWAYWVEKRYVEAKKQLQRSIELEPDRATAYCILAQVQESLGDEKAALSSWQNCLNKQPEKAVWTTPELETWQIQARQRLNPKPGK